MTGFEVLVTGTGDGFSQTRYSASFLVRASGSLTAIECPGMFGKVLRDAALKSGWDVSVADVDDVVVTHIHGDHSNGLELYGYYKFFAQGRKPRVYALGDVFRSMWSGKLRGSMGTMLLDAKTGRRKAMAFGDYFKKVVLHEGVANKVNGLSVDVYRTMHSVPTSALRIRFRGGSIGYSSDTSFDPALIDFLSGCDVIFHETGHGIHTDYRELGRLSPSLRRRIRLIHVPDDFSGADRLMKVLEEGEVITVRGE